jgi:hypothetical protein
MDMSVKHDYVMFKLRYDPVHGWLDEPPMVARQAQRPAQQYYGGGYGAMTSPYYR